VERPAPEPAPGKEADQKKAKAAKAAKGEKKK